jgi:transposase
VTKATTVTTCATIGIDLGDRISQCCVLDEVSGDVVERFGVATTREAFERRFREVPRSKIVLEASTHSPWSSRVLSGLGHRVIVANPRHLRAISASVKKCDRADAETLARLGRADERLLHPIRHRSEVVQRHLGVLHARDQAVRTRTKLINHVRGASKALGVRLPGGVAETFATKARALLPEGSRAALEPLLDLLGEVTATIRRFDKEIEDLSDKHYPATATLRQVQGVGPVTSLAFVLVIGDPERFKKSRSLGSYLGLCPRSSQSGESAPQLPITKAGDRFLRKLLVGSAHYILGPFADDTTLRRFGLEMAARGAGTGKKRAVVAVARRLAVLLHHLWRTGEVYEPLRGAHPIAS